MEVSWLQPPEALGLSSSKKDYPFRQQKVEVVAVAGTAVPRKLLQQPEQKISQV
jgi:hypothetical protein